jgi:hypothetical protein
MTPIQNVHEVTKLEGVDVIELRRNIGMFYQVSSSSPSTFSLVL